MDYLLTFENTHAAIYSEDKLDDEKIPVTVRALPVSIGEFCGICLCIKEENFYPIKKYILNGQLPVEKIFRIEQTENERIYHLCTL